MYIIQNAIKNLFRNKGRNMLMGVILLAVIVTTIIALCINNTATGIIGEYKTRFGSEVTIALDIEKFMSAKERPSIAPLEIDQYIEFSKSEYIQNFILSVEQEGAGVNLKAVDEKPIDPNMSVENSSGSGGEAYVNPNVRLEGNKWDEFDRGLRKVIDGRMVKNDNECLVSREFAELNGLSVGDKVSFKGSIATNTNRDLRTLSYEFTITGIYFDATEEYSGMTRYYSLNRRNEILTTAESIIDVLKPGDYGMMFDAKYYLEEPSMLSSFESEVRSKGLNNWYKVSGNDEGYKKVVGPVEGLKSVTFTFMLVVLILGAVIITLLSSMAIRERKYEIGVLRAMGMKKGKVALGFWIESLILTVMCLFIGLGIGTIMSQPVADTLLAGQVESTKTSESTSPYAGVYIMGGSTSESTLAPLEEIDVSVDLNTLMQITIIAILLASVASAAAIVRITKYEPIKILMERN